MSAHKEMKARPPEVLLKELERLTGTAAKTLVDVPTTAEANRKAVARATELVRLSRKHCQKQ